MKNEEAMNIAIEESKVNLVNNYQNGGPFWGSYFKRWRGCCK